MDEYIIREKVLKKLQMQLIDLESNQDKGEYSELCENRGARDALDEAIYDIRTIKAADVQPVSQWISVKKRLPDENQKCLVYRDINADLKITTGIWHSEWKAFDGLRHGTRLEDTIAWMPLPELPKDGDTE